MKLSALPIITALLLPISSFAVCGFNMPENSSIKFATNDTCSLSIEGSKNYLNMSYFSINQNKGIEELLSDKNFFVEENNQIDFVSEEVNEPKITIHNINQQKTMPVSFNGLHGYMQKADYFVQKIQNFDETDNGYSLNISCIFFAAGNEKKSFKSRFCVPETKTGHKKLDQYLNTLKKITP